MGFFSRKKKVIKKLQLKGFPGHIDTCKCLYLAAEKKLDIELALLDLVEQDQNKDAYLSISPFGKIPSLIDDSLVVSGVAAVLPYIDIKGSGQSLTPKKAANLGLQNYWIEVGTEKLLPHINTLIEERFINPMHDTSYVENQEKITMAKDKINHAFAIADKHLSDKNHFANDYTFAEVHWVPYLHFCSITNQQDLIDKHPSLKQWFEKMQSKPSYQVLPSDEEIKGKDFKNVA